jgi:hypothetical protein
LPMVWMPRRLAVVWESWISHWALARDVVARKNAERRIVRSIKSSVTKS